MIPDTPPRGLLNVARALLGLAALVFIGFYLFAALQRVPYPYELEIGEGDLVIETLHVLETGQPYVEPTLEFTPYTYTPLFFYLSALLCQVLEPGFFPLRLISFVSSLGCLALVFAFVRRETRSSLYGLVAMGLYAASYRLNGGMFDAARVDSLNMVFVLAAVYCVRRPGLRNACLAGLLLAIGFAAKQSALFVALSLGLHALLMRRGAERFAFLGTFAVLTGVSTAIWIWISDGWYWFHVFEMPGMAGWHWHRLVEFWRSDLLGPLPIALALVPVFLYQRWERRGADDALFFTMLLGGMLAIAWASRLHVGGGVNVLFPAHAVLAVLFGLSLHMVGEGEREEAPPPGSRTALAAALGLFQLAILVYNPARYLPTEAQTASRKEFIERLAGLEGEVLMNYAALMPTLAGKEHFTDGAGYFDVVRTDSPLGKDLKREAREEILSGRFAYLVVPERWTEFYEKDGAGFAAEIDRLYEDVGPAVEQVIASRDTPVAPSRLLKRRAAPR